MEVIRDPNRMREWRAGVRRRGARVGFVPTMGALHKGHLSLLALSRGRCDVTVLSIYVNPEQFGPQEDFEHYPRLFDEDCAAAERGGCDVVFAPDDRVMYPSGYATFVSVEGLTEGLCGARRPGHFRGVTTIVLKLFNIVGPDLAVFGQKDAQQAVVLKRMVRDLNLPLELMVGPIVREKDGLAISSRNRYLSDEERGQAPLIYRGLSAAREVFEHGQRDAQAIRGRVIRKLESAPLLNIEYVEAVDTVNLQPLQHVDGTALVALACRTAVSNTRLIDNVVLGGEL